MCYPSIHLDEVAEFPLEVADELLSARAALLSQKSGGDGGSNMTRGPNGTVSVHVGSFEELMQATKMYR